MIPVNCKRCKHYINDLKCSAFPAGIPDDILEGDNDHTEPHPEQIDDTVFEPIVNPNDN